MKPIVAAVVGFFALMTIMTTVFMPAAELIPAQVNPGAPTNGESPVRSKELMGVFKDLGESALKMVGIQASMEDVVKKDPNTPYYVYSLFLCIALVSAAIAINAIGRFDSEEKTIIPVKK